MADQNVIEAFEHLLSQMRAALGVAREQAACASREGRYSEAQSFLAKAEEMEHFIKEIRHKQREWRTIGRRARRNKDSARTRLGRGECTPQDAYRLPILRALVELGGEARINEVLERVYAEMSKDFKPADFKPMPASPMTLRWRYTAQCARQSMVNEGLLRSDCPRGIWAITQKGRELCDKHTSACQGEYSESGD